MTEPLAKLGLRIDSSEIEGATAALDALSAAAFRAEAAMARLVKGAEINVSITPNDARFNAYVDGRMKPPVPKG
tara:strand:+ start:2111 stop:2332 length:222 start_codon:yes stop_codon:yes gene_type:complete